jgi:ech hydrogenase subunit A
MYLLILLILFPLAIALILLCLSNEGARDIFIKISAFLLFFSCLSLVATNFHHDIQYFKAGFPLVDKVMVYLELVLAGYLFYVGLKYKRYLTTILISLQALAVIYFEMSCRSSLIVENNLFVDKLSIIMALIVGIIGGLTSIYATGYMRDFHQIHHPEIKDSRRFFFFVIFVFISAMFGIVFANNLLWLYFFWELTTLCSFLLIGYKRTEESRNNAFYALELNLIGGVAFLIAILYLYSSFRVIEMDKILLLGKTSIMLPVALLCFCGLIKSAQLPFSGWLIGAMVAPVPVSALLHASTMVKAGVYIMLRLALLLEGTLAGFLLALIGGTTFLACSFIAISQTNAKKILAYSTVANLGLVVLCAGVGTYEAMWAAILLIIFHAVTKSLLFLCVGNIEQKLGSMDVEEMEGLIISMPKTSIMMQIGIAGMFLAPFGMLISKWAVLKALVDYNPLLAIFVIFGSSATVLFWVKWMGKLITVAKAYVNIEQGVSLSEWMPLSTLSFLTVGVCFFFPLITNILIEPYLMEAYDRTIEISHGNVVIMTLMFTMVMLFPLSLINYGKKLKIVDAYLGAANIDSTRFQGAAGQIKDIQMNNYYFGKYFGEHRLFNCAALVSFVLILLMFGLSLIWR